MARLDNGSFLMLNAGLHKLVTTPERLSSADRSNGIEWRGSSKFAAPASRDWVASRGWGQWLTAFSTFTILLTKAGGRWRVEPDIL